MSDHDPDAHHRRSIRLKGYDYSQAGAYFVTICTHERKHLFGDIVDGAVKLSEMGKIAGDEWFKTAELRRNVELDAFVVMPNHVHGILVTFDVPGEGTATPCPYNGFGRPKAGSLPVIVGAYKSAVSRRIISALGPADKMIWQRNYYEHVVRNEHELNRMREYIEYNPANWGQDKYNPSNW
jgi:REP element-mobilizing transposase RayT